MGIIEDLIENGSIPPYLYAYPTRSSYRELGPVSVDQIWSNDHRNAVNRSLHLYFHIPFCKYKCGYCNLYTVTSMNRDLHGRYVDAVIAQLEAQKHIVQERDLRTIYFGGGTPSVLSEANFHRIFDKISDIYPNWQSVVDEVCVEATPTSVNSPSFVRSLIAMGVTRLNIGVQSLIDDELKSIGRAGDGLSDIERAFGNARDAGLVNLSTDLIIGLEHQTDDSWRASVEKMLKYRPDTLSTYFLTIRPDAWLVQTGKHSYVRNPDLYKRYDHARDALLNAGYVHETNIRYMIPGRGGYLQKRGHFQGESYLGIGLGARSYNMTCDYTTGDSTVGSVELTERYIHDVQAEKPLVTYGYRFNDEERIRKRFVLGMVDLNLKDLEAYNYVEHAQKFEPILEECRRLNLMQQHGHKLQLTARGLRHRDIISWAFASDAVINLDREFYQGLHEKMSKKKVDFIGTKDLLTRRDSPAAE